MPKLQQAGDTIVEVLVAITIVSLVLTSAYIVTNRNYSSMQDAQERTQAGKLLESQIETVKAYSFDNPEFLDSTKPANAAAFGSSYCFDITSTINKYTAANLCDFDSDGTRPAVSEPKFRILLSAQPANAGAVLGMKFTAIAIWDNVSGDGKDQTQLQYKVFQQQ